MKALMNKRDLAAKHLCEGVWTERRSGRALSGSALFSMRQALLCGAVCAAAVTFIQTGWGQALSASDGSAKGTEVAGVSKLSSNYMRPTAKIEFENYAFDAFGPYPLVGAAATAGINQWTNSPPDWGQGAQGYGKRVGSDFGIAAVATTTRYGLSAAFKEDAMYYRCECGGFIPRVGHAVVSTMTARRGMDGHRVFSLPALVGPYAGSFAAVYGWYPDRFGAKDAFRMGNYSMLAYVAGNISLEFFSSGTHSLIARMHLNNRHGSTEPGLNH